MKKIFKLFVAFSSCALLSACNSSNYTLQDNVYEIENTKYVLSEEKTNLVMIEVKNYGIMVAQLYPEIAPITVENFKKLVSEKFYDNLTFHRVVNGFMIQTGDPTATGGGGSDEEIKGEFSLNGVPNDLSHTRGVLSMARRGAPEGEEETEEIMNSASSQFFIVHQDSQFLDGSYAGFGKLLNGYDVLDKVARIATDEYDKPIVDQVILKIRFLKDYEEKK